MGLSVDFGHLGIDSRLHDSSCILDLLAFVMAELCFLSSAILEVLQMAIVLLALQITLMFLLSSDNLLALALFSHLLLVMLLIVLLVS